MASVIVADFGVIDGVHTYRINGNKEDLTRIIEECKEEDAEFEVAPVIEHVRRSGYTMLLKIKVPIGVGSFGENP